jgi:selenocysteine-specific elongation factor
VAVLGTAGHVDHGKTTLVRALTGIETDRLPEEQRRGITIELGFAPMVVTDDGGTTRTIAVVDVPGHERFVGTMVSGAQGVDAALLVVAADAGVMPQTREHLAILGGLGVGALVVALTRIDLVDAETRELARLEVEEILARTPWAGAPIAMVSSKTGEGIEPLRRAVAEMTRGLDRDVHRQARRKRPVRLSIDRAFVPRGQGVVVTGTLVEGTIGSGDELELAPKGSRVRVRGLHVHGQPVSRAAATERVAVALSGIELAEVRRGDLLSTPGTVAVSRAFDAILTRGAGGRPLGRRARVSIHLGTDEIVGRLVPIAPLGDASSRATIAPGERWFVRAVLERPAPVVAGDRGIVRVDAPIASVGTTLGAFEILRVEPGRLGGGRAAYAETLSRLHEADEAVRARIEVDAAGFGGLERSVLATRLRSRSIPRDAERALAADEVRSGSSARWVGPTARARALDAIRKAVDRHHREHPDDDGLPVAVALGGLPANAAPGLAERAVDLAVSEGELVRVGGRLRRANFRARARPDDPQAIEIASRLRAGGLSPPSLGEIARALSLDESRARALAAALASAKEIVHVQGDLWFDRRALADLKSRLVAALEEKGAITTGEFKELVGASRKFVVPLAEWFDAEKVTLRVGEIRKLRR